jgi:hypothetical protein
VPDGRPTYVIDTNCLDHIKRRPDANLVWDTVIRLIEERRLKTVEQVMGELEKVDPASFARVKPYRKDFVERITPELFDEAGRISETYPRMSRPWHQNDSADPWLLAAAKLRGYVVVTDEANRRQRIPVVCQREGVQCIDLTAFVEAEMPEE